MGREARSSSKAPAVEARIRTRAGRSRGILTHRELVESGLSGRQVYLWRKRGRLLPRGRGVYLVDSPVEPPGAREMAAVKAAGSRVAVSHPSAATLLGLPIDRSLADEAAARVHLSTTTNRTTTRRDLRIHRVASLTNVEVKWLGELPVTAAARTIADLAPLCTPRHLERMISEALALRLTTRAMLEAQVARSSACNGILKLRAVMAAGEPHVTESEAEELLLDIVHGAGLPRPETNVHVEGFRIDVLWRRERVVVEINGYAAHSRLETFKRDHRKRRTLQLAGYVPLEFTYWELTGERARCTA
ncbi:MAG: type IV toxin-antitoxin system AbiEi family antitoxin domain-containing protein, partial [Solirubrobacterales bacterium]|nr:type IV toxin-antitoxin system AbiEi family antitoxin domain-containing protein [Solirubrobacterales bacterium]